jgi:hypothetical protein
MKTQLFFSLGAEAVVAKARSAFASRCMTRDFHPNESHTQVICVALLRRFRLLAISRQRSGSTIH